MAKITKQQVAVVFRFFRGEWRFDLANHNEPDRWTAWVKIPRQGGGVFSGMAVAATCHEALAVALEMELDAEGREALKEGEAGAQ